MRKQVSGRVSVLMQSADRLDEGRGCDILFCISRAGLTQLVECLLPKQNVASSNLATRYSMLRSKRPRMGSFLLNISPGKQPLYPCSPAPLQH